MGGRDGWEYCVASVYSPTNVNVTGVCQTAHEKFIHIINLSNKIRFSFKDKDGAR